MSAQDAPFDLYIAAYSDPTAAHADWDQIKQLARDKVVTIEGLVLVSRDADGKIHVKDDDHDAGRGAAIGAVAGAIVGLIFPPALLASAAVGAGIGAGTGVLADLITTHGIRSDVENTLPPGSSGIVALVQERWVSDVEKALAKAEKAEHHHLH